MRHRYIIAYDITEPKRWRKVHKLMLGHGSRLQYSVFICCLSATERIELETALAGVINQGEDKILIANLGLDHAGGLQEIDFIGPRPAFERPGPVIL